MKNNIHEDISLSRFYPQSWIYGIYKYKRDMLRLTLVSIILTQKKITYGENLYYATIALCLECYTQGVVSVKYADSQI